jgi:hypothetical protein
MARVPGRDPKMALARRLVATMMRSMIRSRGFDGFS